MRFLSLFSGIEAASVAWCPLGWECAGVAEIKPAACRVLAHHYPDVPNLGDVTKITEEDIALLGHIDLIVFGSPCQDLSVAGKRKGLAGERSGLFHAAIRIIGWAREHCGLRFALWENVPGAFSSNKGRDFAAVVGALAGCADPDPPRYGWGIEGAAVGDLGLVEWGVLDAQWFGVPQRRRRVFALADFGNWADRPPVLLEPQSLRGNSPPRRGQGEDVAGTLEARARGGGFPGTDGACLHHVVPGRQLGSGVVVSCPDVAATLRSASDSPAAHGKVNGTDRMDMVVVGALTAAKGPAGHGGSGLATDKGAEAGHIIPVLAFPANLSGTQCASTEDLSPSLGAKNPMAVAFALRGRDEGAVPEIHGDGSTIGALRAAEGGSSRDYLAFGGNNTSGAIEVTPALLAQPGSGYKVDFDTETFLADGWRVRRLTPTECERLQGFPDGYTDVAKGNRPMADGPRYNMLGDSMAVPVMLWIGRQIEGLQFA